MLEGCNGDSLELALELIHRKIPTSQLKAELDEDGTRSMGKQRMQKVAVKDLSYTHESIKRMFHDGGQFHELGDDLLI